VDGGLSIRPNIHPHQVPYCFLVLEILASLLSTGWLQERIQA